MKEKTYWLKYTLLFCIILVVVFFPFWLKGNSLVNLADGYNQYYPIWTYAGKYFRECLQGNIKEFDFSIGYGEGIIPYLNYYGFGDIFLLLSVFFSEKWSALGFSLTVVLKIYFCGVTFSNYAKRHIIDKRFILLGAIAYAFSQAALVNGLEFWQNLNPMIWLPMILAGTEEVVERCEKEKTEISIKMIIGLFLLAISGFYYLYMVTIVTIIYAIVYWKICVKNTAIENSDFITILRNGLLNYLIGLLLSCIILLPSIWGYMESTRTVREYKPAGFFLYDISEIIELIKNIFVSRAWQSSLGIPIMVFLGTFVLKTTKNIFRCWKVLFLALMLLYFTPLTGTVMNGFSYSTNRWTFFIQFFAAILLAGGMSWGREINRINARIAFIVIACVCICNVISDEISLGNLFRNFVYAVIILVNFWLIYQISREKNKKISLKYIYAMTVFNVLINGVFITWPVAIGGDGYSANFCSYKFLSEENKNTIPENDSNQFARKDLQEGSLGYAMLNSVNGSTEYFSILNKNIFDFYMEMQISPGIRSASHILKGLDSRKVLQSLLSVDYYQEYESEDLEKSEQKQNTDSISLGTLYSDYLEREDFEQYNIFKKMDCLTETIVLERDLNGFEKYTDENESLFKKIDMNISYENMLQENREWNVNEESRITLSFDDTILENPGELYVRITGLKNLDTSLADIFVGNKSIQVRNQNEPYYIGTNDFLIHVKKPENGKIHIEFQNTGKFECSNIEVFWYPLDNFYKNINGLKKNSIKNIRIENNQISGEVEAHKDSVLFLNIPKSIGWSAKVDGIEEEILKADIAFMAIPVSEGVHQIVLEYKTPGLRVGIFFSVSGLVLLVLLKKSRLFHKNV